MVKRPITFAIIMQADTLKQIYCMFTRTWCIRACGVSTNGNGLPVLCEVLNWLRWLQSVSWDIKSAMRFLSTALRNFLMYLHDRTAIAVYPFVPARARLSCQIKRSFGVTHHLWTSIKQAIFRVTMKAQKRRTLSILLGHGKFLRKWFSNNEWWWSKMIKALVPNNSHHSMMLSFDFFDQR